MKNHTAIYLLLLLSILLVYSCGDNDDDDLPYTHDDVLADVYIQKRKDTLSSTGNTYALAFMASGQGIKKCQATAPNGDAYLLQTYWRNHSYRLVPNSSDYQNTMPESGLYQFYFEFSDGQTKTIEDELFPIEIDAISSATISHNSGFHGSSVSWPTVDSVDEYVLMLTDNQLYQNQSLYYQGGFTELDNGTYFDSTTQVHPGWNYPLFPKYGDSCYIVVQAWKNEENEQNSPDRNRQMLSEYSHLIVCKTPLIYR